MDKQAVTVIGVMSKDFSFFNDDCDYWAPQPIRPLQQPSKQGFLIAIGRFRRGTSMRQAQAEMHTLAAQLASADLERNQAKGALVQPLQEAAYGYVRSPLLILQGAVAFVLLIGCANVAGLLLARATSRRTEVAVRTALGAERGRMVRQLLTENFLVSVLGGILGVAFSWAGQRAFVAAAPPNFPRINEVTLDGTDVVFTTVIVVLTAVIFGIVPAIQTSKPDLVNSLKDSGRSGTESFVRQRLRRGLVTLQIALALVLLIGAGLMINSFVRVQNKDLGADPKGLLSFDFRFPQGETFKPFGRYRGVGIWDVMPVATLTFQPVFERVQGMPGVVSAAAISRPPHRRRH